MTKDFSKTTVSWKKRFHPDDLQAANFFQWKSPGLIKSYQKYEVGRVADKISAKQASRRDTVRELIFFVWQVWRQRGIRRGFGQKMGREFDAKIKTCRVFPLQLAVDGCGDYTSQVNFLPVYHGIHHHHFGDAKPEGIAVSISIFSNIFCGHSLRNWKMGLYWFLMEWHGAPMNGLWMALYINGYAWGCFTSGKKWSYDGAPKL